MSTTIELTVGDTGITVSGLITQRAFIGLASLAGCAVTFSLLPTAGGQPIVDQAPAVLGALDNVAGTVAVSYRLQAADVASGVGQARVRWTFTLADNGKFHAPGASDQQTFIRINA